MGNDLNVSGIQPDRKTYYVRDCFNGNSNKNITIPIGQPAVKKDVTPGLVIEKNEEDNPSQYIEQNSSNVPTVEEVQENLNYEDDAVQLNSARQLVTKKDRQEAINEARDEFMKNGTSADNSPITDKKQAKKMAKAYVENRENLENMYSTRTYIDKEAYEKAEEERKAEYKNLKKEYRSQGYTRRAARRQAKAQLVNNEYLDNKKARAYVQEHSEQFLDEQGNFSQAKYKQFALDLTNTHTQQDETTNAHLSLKERREAAETMHTKPSVVRDIARSAGADVERDNTGLIRTGVIVGATGLLAGAGALAVPAITSTAGAGAGAAAGAGTAAGGAGASAGAAAGATATVEGVGAIVGGSAGLAGGSLLANLIKDKGRKETPVYEPGKPQEVPPSTQPPAHPSTPTPPSTPVQPAQPLPPQDEPCPEDRWTSETCDHAVGKGDNWSSVAQAKVLINGKKPDGKLLRAYVHAEKLKHGITNFGLNTMPNVYSQRKYEQLKTANPEKAEEYKAKTTLRLYSDFNDLLADKELVKKHPELELLRNAEITFNCDGKVSHKTGGGNPQPAYTKWFGGMTAPVGYKQDCHDLTPVMIK